MFAISFDLDYDEARVRHPKGARAAYKDIEYALGRFKFDRIQGSLYITRNEDLANLFFAVAALKKLKWFPARCETFVRFASIFGRT